MKRIYILTICAMIYITIQAQQNQNDMGRDQRTQEVYNRLFGGAALTGVGNDPELMEILQKNIFGDIFYIGDLNDQTRELLTIVALSTMQTLPQLKSHVEASLNVGVEPIEIREAIYMCAPWIGYPKTLNAITVANEVFTNRDIKLPLESAKTTNDDDRLEKGLAIQKELYGKNMKQSFAGLPDGLDETVSDLLTATTFGDYYTRGVLSLQDKELIFLAIQVTEWFEPQIKSHIVGNLKVGNDKAKLTYAMIHLSQYVGLPRALNAIRLINDTKVDVLDSSHKVRISKIVVDPTQLDAYNALLKEEIEASMDLEPGVLTLYATANKERANHITILEIYASEEAYKSHLETPHFKKYKQGTISMVEELELIDTNPLIEGLKIK